MDKRVYTDGHYLLTFKDNPEEQTVPYLLSIRDPETGASFSGVIGFGNGLSTPQVSFETPCRDREKDTRSCHYKGTVYQIDGAHTKYGWGEEKVLPLLFPEMYSAYYYAANEAGVSLKAFPRDLWMFKSCRK